MAFLAFQVADASNSAVHVVDDMKCYPGDERLWQSGESLHKEIAIVAYLTFYSAFLVCISCFFQRQDKTVNVYLYQPEEEPANNAGLNEPNYDTVLNRRWRAQALPSVRAHFLGIDIHRLPITRHGFDHGSAQTDDIPAPLPPVVIYRDVQVIRSPIQIFAYRHGRRYHRSAVCSRESATSDSESLLACQLCCDTRNDQ